MLRKIVSGMAGLTMALSLTHCTQEDPGALSPGADGQAMAGKPALSVAAANATPYFWSFNETFPGTNKPALVHNVNGGLDYDQLYMVRRSGSRLESFFLAAEQIFHGPSAPFGPTNAFGDPAIAVNGADGNNLYIAIRTTTSSGRIELWRPGRTTPVTFFGSGLNNSFYGSPAMVYNTVTGRLHVVYREGTAIRHWIGTRSSGVYSWANQGLIPGTGGTGTSVISAVSMAQGTDGRLTIVARRSEGNLRFWYTGTSSAPFTWTTGPAFGYNEVNTEWPSITADADGTLQVLAVGRQISDTPELMHFEIKNNVPVLLSIIAGPGNRQPVVTALSPGNLWMAVAQGAGSRLANGVR